MRLTLVYFLLMMGLGLSLSLRDSGSVWWLTFGKCLLVAFCFMELRYAHRLWQVLAFWGVFLVVVALKAILVV